MKKIILASITFTAIGVAVKVNINKKRLKMPKKKINSFQNRSVSDLISLVEDLKPL